ncbi:elongation of very long chain fatty acids protein AAEL008004-like [Coccinella septempunctata]|uniref:elongation of very long chain fatty acids protein AAEL008004-like n=1 Tax=Coccinella septempunctata TaxID=41139 RepID=UPI001D077F10|nr:elongation of very long chain fatty acids protein AAEL008004-like [Coccinella septempunctata]XP_044763495.1 elongation of very long chain fatty acids protein AAEL008004-like [Coccinella septempunctata]
MVEVIGSVQHLYKYAVDDLADLRTNDYLFAASPWRPIGIFLIYLLVVKKILPDFMRKREAMKIDSLILFYNFTQITFNGYLLYKVIPLTFKMSPFCSPVDYSDNPDSRLQLDLCYLYYILKIYDLLDTVFFILRKKDRQVTFLHIYHHGMMVTFPWLALRYVPGGNTLFVGVCNTIVHIVMYFYYGVSLWNSGTKKSLWWKKHLTQLQLIQFVLLTVMAFSVVFHPNCSFPKALTAVGLAQNLYITYLFGTFYYKTYIVPSKMTHVEDKKID